MGTLPLRQAARNIQLVYFRLRLALGLRFAENQNFWLVCSAQRH